MPKNIRDFLQLYVSVFNNNNNNNNNNNSLKTVLFINIRDTLPANLSKSTIKSMVIIAREKQKYRPGSGFLSMIF